MKLETQCKKLFSVDIDEIKILVDKITEKEWDEWNYRQREYYPHVYTKTYPLAVWSDLDNFDSEKENKCTIYLKNKDSKLWNPIEKIVEKIENYYNGKCANIILTNLPSKTFILPHVDKPPLLKLSHRCHIPIKTNKDVIFYIDDIPFHFESGGVYEISNMNKHSVRNGSNEDRIHLILDIFPKDVEIDFNFINF